MQMDKQFKVKAVTPKIPQALAAAHGDFPP